MCIGIKRHTLIEEKIFKFNEKDNETFIAADYTVSEVGESFSKVFDRYLEDFKIRFNITQKAFADLAELNPPEISNIKSGYRAPALPIVVKLCLAMRLHYERSNYLIHTAGFTLNDSKEHRIYKLFLSGCAFSEYYNTQNCNELLEKHGYTSL